MGAATVSMLRLPLSSIIIALVVSQAGVAATPLIIVAVVVAYLVVLALPTQPKPDEQVHPPDQAGSPAGDPVAPIPAQPGT